tara:strand:+ start:434 stop:700 length:267 start_codon:yes stop_codon:yes gene_type:complete
MRKDSSIKKHVVETLMTMGAKKVDKSLNFVKDNLLIMHKDTGVKYTVKGVDMAQPKNPVVHAYRYVEGGEDTFDIQITKESFKDYEPV